MSAPVIERRYAARGAALEVFRRREKEVLLAGPAGTGKSRAALEKIHAMCLRTPNVRALMVRQTLVSLTATGLVTYKTHVAAESLASGHVYWFGGSQSEPPAFRYSNGSTITVGGMDKPDKVMSAEYDVAYVQEATELTVEAWEKITTRLRNGAISFQQLIADCNPQQPTHWLKKRCDEGRCVMLHSRHEDNPVLFNADGSMTKRGQEYMELLDALTGVRKERLRYGRWAAAEGIVYEGWDPRIHLSDRKVLPDSWERVWSIDFGFTNPFVWQQWAVDPDGRLWLEHEIYRTKRLVEDHVEDIKDVVLVKKNRVIGADGKIDAARSQWKYSRPRKIICDHDAEDRATFERHMGMSTSAAKKSVSDGIQAMQTRLKVQGDGLPRLLVLRDSLVSRDEERAQAGKPLGFVAEIEGYIFPIGQDGKPQKEDPVKDDDHSMDASRYTVADEDLQPRGLVRWM